MSTEPNRSTPSPRFGRLRRGRAAGAVVAAAAALSLSAVPSAHAVSTVQASDGRSFTGDPSGGRHSDRLKRFQAAHGLRATGREDPATNQKLKTASPRELRALYPAAEASTTLTGQECTNARTVIGVGKGKGIPQRGMEVALMTAMQESKFYNYTEAVDHDSLGIFQQRPSTGWGTPEQITNVVTSTQSFYGVASYGSNPGLLQIDGWESMSRNDAAQAVQNSGVPDAYAQWESWAIDFYAAQAGSVDPITGDTGTASPCTGSTGGTYDVDTFANASVYASPTSTTATGTLYQGTNYVYCKVYGREISDSSGSYNHYWLKTDPDEGPADQYVSAYYLSNWGNDEAKDNNGTVIPDC